MKSGKDLWVSLAQFAAWLSGLVLQFVSTPARLRITEDVSFATTRFVQFVLTALAGLILILFWRRCRPRHVRGWAFASAAALILGLAAFGGYQHLNSRWTCSYYGQPAVVIGATYKPHAEAFRAKQIDKSCTRMLTKYGENWEIWDENEISDRYFILIALFGLVVISFSLAVMFLLQAWKCLGRRAADLLPESP